jgi:hypothetical protein
VVTPIPPKVIHHQVDKGVIPEQRVVAGREVVQVKSLDDRVRRLGALGRVPAEKEVVSVALVRG